MVLETGETPAVPVLLGSVIWLLCCCQVLSALGEMFNLLFDHLYTLKNPPPLSFLYACHVKCLERHYFRKNTDSPAWLVLLRQINVLMKEPGQLKQLVLLARE